MLVFMSFILVLAVLMFRSDTDALVEKDYYEKGLRYDETYRLKAQVLLGQRRPQDICRKKIDHHCFSNSCGRNSEACTYCRSAQRQDPDFQCT